MNILSLNINGLKAFMASRVERIEKFYDTDIICFQETKCSQQVAEDLLGEIFPHKVFINPSQFKNGYAGVATLIDTAILENEVKHVYSDEIMEDYGSGRIICTVFKKFILINVYTLNSGNKQSFRKEWDEKFRAYIRRMMDNTHLPVVIVGDLNVVGGPLDHWCYDRVFNTMPGLYDFELEGFNKLKQECQLEDAFRVRNPSTVAYSWYSYMGGARYKNHGWRIDYTLVNQSLIPYIKETQVMSAINASDHCPVYIDLDYDRMQNLF